MKRIMFNDKYGLTDAVLQRRKTMTRRIIPLCENDLNFLKVADSGEWLFSSRTCLDGAFPAYNVGDEIAVAQAYKTLRWPALPGIDWRAITDEVTHSKGWTNKMFVKAEYMPHRIRISGIKVERLQDISNEDCLKEGVFHYFQPPFNHEYDRYAPWPPCIKPYKHDIDNLKYFSTAQAAFAHLIDRISGRGTWNSNPWVYAYDVELVKLN